MSESAKPREWTLRGYSAEVHRVDTAGNPIDYTTTPASITPQLDEKECVRVLEREPVERELERLRARTHEIAAAKDQQYREAMRDHARLKVAVDQARERTRDWKADWASPRDPDAPFQWWSHTSHNHAMEAVALVADRNEMRDALAELVRLKDLKVQDRAAYDAELNAKEAAWDKARELLNG